MFFTNLDSILKSFTKLDKKLDTHIAALKSQDEMLAASEIGIAEARKEINYDIGRATRVKKNVAALIN